MRAHTNPSIYEYEHKVSIQIYLPETGLCDECSIVYYRNLADWAIKPNDSNMNAKFEIVSLLELRHCVVDWSVCCTNSIVHIKSTPIYTNRISWFMCTSKCPEFFEMSLQMTRCMSSSNFGSGTQRKIESLLRSDLISGAATVPHVSGNFHSVCACVKWYERKWQNDTLNPIIHSPNGNSRSLWNFNQPYEIVQWIFTKKDSASLCMCVSKISFDFYDLNANTFLRDILHFSLSLSLFWMNPCTRLDFINMHSWWKFTIFGFRFLII